MNTEKSYELTTEDIDLMKFYPDPEFKNMLYSDTHKHVKYEVYLSLADPHFDLPVNLKIRETGEVLQSDIDNNFWKGKMIDLYRLKLGKKTAYLLPDRETSKQVEYIVKSIKRII